MLLPHLRTAYSLDLATAGLVMTVLWFAYAAGQLPGGLLTDRIGEAATMVTSTVLAAGGLVLVVTAESKLVLFTATVIFGAGTALYGVARFTALSELYPDQLGTAVGLVAAVGDLANSVLPTAAGLLAAVYAWQFGFGFLVPLFVLTGVWLWFAIPTQTASSKRAADSFSMANAWYVLGEINDSSILQAIVVQTFNLSVWQAFTSFYPLYLVEVKNISEVTAGGLLGLFFAFGIVIKPVFGKAYDRIGIRRSLLVAIFVSGTSLTMLPLIVGFWPIVGLTIPLSSLLGVGTIIGAYLTDSLPDNMQGTGLGIIRSFYITIAAASPAIFGAVADRGLFEEGFLALAALSGLTIVVVLRLPKRQ